MKIWLYRMFHMIASVIVRNVHTNMCLIPNVYQLSVKNVIYLSTAIGLPPSGSGTVHIYTQAIHRTKNKTTRITNKTTQTTNLEECWSCQVFASFTLVFALQLREKHGKPSFSVLKILLKTRKIFRVDDRSLLARNALRSR
jgi:hypothetical protein